jgi:hypothetical protein
MSVLHRALPHSLVTASGLSLCPHRPPTAARCHGCENVSQRALKERATPHERGGKHAGKNAWSCVERVVMGCRSVVGAAIAVLFCLGSVDAYASYLLSASECSRNTAAGASIMYATAVTSASRSVLVSGLTSGGTYTAGATVSVSLSGSGGQGLLEVVGGGSFSSGTRGCSNRRTTTLSGASLVLPASGALTIRGLWASGQGPVSVAEFTLTGPGVDPGAPPPPPARTCADTNADGTVDNFDCASHANDLHASPSAVTCAADECTATQCCTVVPGSEETESTSKASSGGRIAAAVGTLGALLLGLML